MSASVWMVPFPFKSPYKLTQLTEFGNMDLAVLCSVMCEVKNGTNRHYLAVFSVDVAVCGSPPPCSPIGVLVILATLVKQLSKIMGNSVSHPFNSLCIDKQ